MVEVILSANRHAGHGEPGFVILQNLVNHHEAACSELIEKFASSVVAIRDTAGQFLVFRRVRSLKQRVASL